MRRRITKEILIFLFLILGIIGYRYMPWYKPSEDFINMSKEQTLKTFLSLTTTKAFLHIIEGSTIGTNILISGELQMGDMVQPLCDFVDILWKITLISLLVLYLYQFTIKDFLVTIVPPWILILLLLLSFTARHLFPQLPQKISKGIHSFSKAVMLFAFTLYWILPLSIYTSSVLYKHLLGSQEKRVAEISFSIRQDLSNIGEEIQQWIKRIPSKREREEGLEALKNKTVSITQSLVDIGLWLTLGLLLRLLFLPLTIYILYTWTRNILITEPLTETKKALCL